YPPSATAARRLSLETFTTTDLPQLRAFQFGLSDLVRAEELAILFRAPFLGRLDELHADGMLLPDALEMLGDVPGADRYRSLTALVRGDDADSLGTALSGWRFPRLSWLQINRVTDDGVKRLAERPFAPNLRVLDLFAHDLAPDGMAALASGRFAA